MARWRPSRSRSTDRTWVRCGWWSSGLSRIDGQHSGHEFLDPLRVVAQFLRHHVALALLRLGAGTDDRPGHLVDDHHGDLVGQGHALGHHLGPDLLIPLAPVRGVGAALVVRLEEPLTAAHQAFPPSILATSSLSATIMSSRGALLM